MHVTKTFRDLGVHPALCDALEAGGITHPFPIQELTLPLALDGHDLIGQARTGTGKTLAFGIPLLQRLDASRAATQALVIVPTRELCLQVHEDLRIGTSLDISSISVYGGVGYEEQIDALTGGVHVVVGTPGRLLDHLNRGNLDLSNVTQLVLDEADEMLDMGFLPDVERLVEACQGPDRHTMLFSATMPTPIVKLARRYMNHPTFTRADHEVKTTADNVTQYFFQVHRMDKPRLLARILQDEDRGGVYVFVRTKHMADRLVNELEELDTPAIAIHGDLRQSQREKNLDRFRAGKATVLVATEVAARGLDVQGVTHVVNYDCPDDEKMYLHRIGRTARAGESGKAITFAEFNEVDRLNVIRKKVEATDAELLQVFSTSPVLEELFDLPSTRPWDRPTADAREREGQRGSGSPRPRRADRARDQDKGARTAAVTTAAAAATAGAVAGATRTGERDDPVEAERGEDTDRPRQRRRGSTDGRPKGGREREGRGRDRDADRDRRRAARPETAESDRGAETSSDADEATTRTRTRTRTRQPTTGDGEPTSTEPAQDQDAAAGADAEPTPRAGGSGSGRTRARGRGHGRGAGRSAAQTADRSADGPADRSADRGAAGPRNGDDAEEARAHRDDRRGEEATRSAKGRGGRSNSGGRAAATRARGGGPTRDGGTGRRSAQESTPGVTATRRGEEARGKGQPQRARRVRVEHLP